VGVLADVTDPEVAVRAIERVAPRVAQALHTRRAPAAGGQTVARRQRIAALYQPDGPSNTCCRIDGHVPLPSASGRACLPRRGGVSPHLRHAGGTPPRRVVPKMRTRS
jgi:hypothetical protein